MIKKILLLLVAAQIVRAEPTDILARVKECIAADAQILDKEPALAALRLLEKEGVLQEVGDDDLRSKYVMIQGYIEDTLATLLSSGQMSSLIGVIHTELPATPLCTTPNDMEVKALLGPTIQLKKEKLHTVRARSSIMRAYLEKGGILYAVYSQGGLEKRDPDHQKTFLKTVDTYPKNLHARVFKTTTIDPEMVGATYLFKDKLGKTYSFSIKSQQAVHQKEKSTWGLWFGSLDHPPIQARLTQVCDYLKTACDLDLRQTT